MQVRPRPLNGGYNQLFEGLEDDISPSPEAFLPRSSLKKLVLQSNRYSEPETPDPVETVSKSEQLIIEESSQPGELVLLEARFLEARFLEARFLEARVLEARLLGARLL